MTISETIKALETIKEKYGDLEIYDVQYGLVDYVEVTNIEPTVIKISVTGDDFIVIFQEED